MFVVFAVVHPEGPERGIYIGGTTGQPSQYVCTARWNARKGMTNTALIRAMAESGDPGAWKASPIAKFPGISADAAGAEAMKAAKAEALKAARAKYGDAVLNREGAVARYTRAPLDPYGLAPDLPDLPDV